MTGERPIVVLRSPLQPVVTEWLDLPTVGLQDDTISQQALQLSVCLVNSNVVSIATHGCCVNTRKLFGGRAGERQLHL